MPQKLYDENGNEVTDIYLPPRPNGSPTQWQPSGNTTMADAANYQDAYMPRSASGDTFNKPVNDLGSMPAQSVLEGLPADLASAYKKTLSSMITGESFESQKALNNEGFIRAANAIRAQNANTMIGREGQGIANASQMGTEQTILSAAAENELNNRIQQEQLKQQGLTSANTLLGMETQNRQFNRTQALNERNQAQENLRNNYLAAVDAGDFGTAAGIFKSLTGKDLDTTQLKTTQDYKNAIMGQEISKGNITLAGMTESLGATKYNDIQNMVNTGATIEQINAQYGQGTITPEQYDSMKAVAETTFQQKTIDINKYSIEENIKLAKDKFVLEKDTFNEQKKEWESVRASRSAADQRAGDELYGFTDAKGNHVMGTLELQNDSNAIQRQGMTLNEAQIKGYIDGNGIYHKGTLAIAEEEAGREADTLYGFDDPNTGEHIPGTLELAKKRFDLESDTLDEQIAEWKDKYRLMSNEDKRAGDALYGSTITDSNGNTYHIPGSMEIQAKAVEIQSQGLSLEEAQLKGYTDPESGKHVAGAIENAATAMGLQGKSVQAQMDEIYGYDQLQGDGVTYKHIVGKLETMDAESQDRIKQLYGYTDPKTGKHVEGSMELNQKAVNAQVDVARDTFAANYGGKLSNGQTVTGLEGRRLAIQEKTAASEEYWNTSKKVAAYVQTNIDADPNSKDWQMLMADWYEKQIGKPADIASDEFKKFCVNELKAAQDNRLTNPIDQSIYTVNSSKELSTEDKAKMIAILKSVPEETTFKTDSSGKVVVDTGENLFDPDLTYDNTNTFASHPSMFAAAGGIWTGEGAQSFLTPGQKITLKTNFGIQDTKRTIPLGNYTGKQIGNQVMLESEDGKYLYGTKAKYDYTEEIALKDALSKAGYAWNDTLKRWEK